MKKALGRTQTLRVACRKVEPKISLRSCAPVKRVYGGAKIFGSALQRPARSDCVSPSAFFHLFFTLGIKDPEGFVKTLEENCRSDHHSGQSSNTKESCSSAPLNRCTSTETRWNKKAVSLTRRRSDDKFSSPVVKKVNEVDPVIGPRVSTAIGSKM